MSTAKENSILSQANDLVYGARACEHGDFWDNFRRMAKIYMAWRGEELLRKFLNGCWEFDTKFVEDVVERWKRGGNIQAGFDGLEANCLLQCLKMAREIGNSGNQDNRLDECGYIELRDRYIEMEKEIKDARGETGR